MYKEKIRTLQKYLLDPKKAIDDKFSYFDSLHDILAIEQNKGNNELTSEIYNLFGAVFTFLLKPYRTDRYSPAKGLYIKQIPLKPTEELRITRTEYFDEDMLSINKPIKALRYYFNMSTLSFEEESDVIILYEKELNYQYKYFYYIDEALGFNFTYSELLKRGALGTDFQEYLSKGFDLKTNDRIFDRYSLYKQFESDYNNNNIFSFFGIDRIEKDDSPLKKICNTFHKINFTNEKEMKFADYIDYLRKENLKEEEERVKTINAPALCNRIHSEETTKRWFHKLVDKKYINASCSDFDALANKFAPTNRIEWIKKSTKRNGLASSALIDLLHILDYGYIRDPLPIGKNMTDERKKIKDAAKKYFDFPLTASYFDNPQSLYYEELNNIITK